MTSSDFRECEFLNTMDDGIRLVLRALSVGIFSDLGQSADCKCGFWESPNIVFTVVIRVS